jgi:hypothetical protein
VWERVPSKPTLVCVALRRFSSKAAPSGHRGDTVSRLQDLGPYSGPDTAIEPSADERLKDFAGPVPEMLQELDALLSMQSGGM